jgi:predicted nucleic acid-binding protein
VPRYLADSSIWGWANSTRRPDIQAKLADRFQSGEIVTCAPVALEAMHRARDGNEYDRIFGLLFEPLDWLPLGAAIGERAIEVQREMAETSHGNHLRPAVDYLIAAIAEAAQPEVALWCFDRDLEIICEHTGQPYESEESSTSGR